MAEEEWRVFVSHGTRTGKLATVRADGAPHVTPVWFVLDGGDLLLTTGETTVKARNMRRTGRAALCVDDESPPFAFVRIDAAATFEDDPRETLRVATLIGERYMGEERAEEFGRRNAVPGEALVRLRPRRVVAIAGVAD